MSSNPHLDDELYRLVGEEVARKEFHPGAMARAVAEANGNNELIQGLYIKSRHAELLRQFERQTAAETPWGIPVTVPAWLLPVSRLAFLTGFFGVPGFLGYSVAGDGGMVGGLAVSIVLVILGVICIQKFSPGFSCPHCGAVFHWSKCDARKYPSGAKVSCCACKKPHRIPSRA